MATLFNTKISATYEGLLKTIDNAAITATLKELTDGSGNQSGLYLNTAGDFKVSSVLEWGSLKDTGTGVTITQFVTSTDGIENFNNNTTIPTSAAVKSYVDANGGGLAGSGTTNFVSKWSNATTLADSIIFDNGTNVGIGTSNPVSLLTLAGNNSITFKGASAQNQISTIRTDINDNLFIEAAMGSGKVITIGQLSGSNGRNIRISGGTNSYQNDNHEFKTFANSSILYMNSTGVGIGTTSPAEKLEVVGYVKSSIGFKALNNTTLLEADNNTVLSNTAFYNMLFKTNNAERVRITNGGNVGIGTTSPSSKLQVNGTFLTTDNGTIEGRTNLKKDLIIRGTDALANQGVARFYVDSSNKLFIDTSNDGSNLFCINEIGNVGINTSSPSEKLEVVGNLLVTGTIIGSGGSFLPLAGGTMTGDLSLGDNVRIRCGNSSDLQIYHDGSNSFIKQSGSGKLILETSSTGINVQSGTGETRFTQSGVNSEIKIDDSSQVNKIILKASGNSLFNGGNIGIGTTTPSAKLHIKGASKFESSSNTDLGTFGVDGGGAFLGSFSNVPLRFIIQNGVKTPLYINTDGNVGINTTSPSEKLEVNGNLLVTGTIIGSGGSFLPLAGGIMTGNTVHEDNVKANFGDANDLQIYHNGSDSYIDEVGTGSLYNRTTLFIVQNTDSTKNSIIGNPSADVKLYYNGVKKIETTSTGISVTGNGIFTNRIGVGTTNPTSELDVVGTITTSGSVKGGSDFSIFSEFTNRGRIDLSSSSATNANQISFLTNGNIQSVITKEGNFGVNTTSPAEKFSVSGNIAVQNSNEIMLGGATGDTKIGKLYNVGGVLSLDGEGTRNIRLGSTTNGEVLWIDNSNKRVGIGTSAPSDSLTVAGNARVTGILKVADGNAGAPSIAHRADENTGIYFPANDNIGFSTSSSEAMRIIANGNLGIGTSSPSQKLDVDGNVRISSERYYYASGTGAGFGSDASGNFKIRQNDADLIFGSGNNVGIGTSTPIELLHLFGTAPSLKIEGNGVTSANIKFKTNGTERWNIGVPNGETRFTFNNGTSDKVSILSNGNFGIATTSPAGTLDVNNAETGVFFRRLAANLQFVKLTTDSTNNRIESSVKDFVLKTTDATPLHFETNNTTRLTVQSNGNIGIGTTLPTEKLEVDGGDIKIKDASAGLILTSPNGTVYKITVANDGTVTSTAV